MTHLPVPNHILTNALPSLNTQTNKHTHTEKETDTITHTPSHVHFVILNLYFAKPLSVIYCNIGRRVYK